MRRLCVALLSTIVSAGVFIISSPVGADLGDVQQLSGTDGCVSEDGTGGACADGVALNGATSVFVSPDNENVYAATEVSYSIAVFDRDTTTGVLTQKSGTDACVSAFGGSCATAVGADNPRGPQAVTVSPDGESVYLAAHASSSVAIFDRDPTTGVITQKPAPAGCISLSGSGGQCVVGRGLEGAFGVVVSPDNENVYVTSSSTSAGGVAIFDRDTATGALTQKPGTAGCITETGTGGACTDGRALLQSETMVIPQDGENLYLAAFGSAAVVVFDRDTATGELTQKPGNAGCISDNGTAGGCVDGRGLLSVNGIAMSPDDENVYGASLHSDAIAVFDRDPSTGTLAQKAGTDGCISDAGTDGCADGVALDGPEDITVAKDGRTVHSVSKFSGALNIFVRDVRTGVLMQKPGTAGCVSETGNGGACATGVALGDLNSIADSPDQKNLYLAAHASNAVAVFGRDLVDVDPTAVDDDVAVAEDDSPTPVAVQDNDIDPDNGANTVTSVTQPLNGAVVITNAGFDVTYEPNADYCNGGAPTDDFTYTLNGGSSATVRVSVTCVDDLPVAADDAATVGEDVPPTTIDVLANDADVDGGPLTVESVTQPSNGTATITNAGADLAYEPNSDYCNGGSPTDDFTYTITGGSMATVRVTVSCVDDRPAAADDAVALAEGDPATTIDVRANDSDIDGGPSMIVATTQPSGGTVVITNGGADLTYQPTGDFCNDGAPTDDFTYTLNGGSTATVRVSVTCAVVQPDAQVKVVTDADFRGADVYNSTGEDQWVLINRKRGKKMEFDFLIQNDSTLPETFTVTGNGNNRAYRARYFDDRGVDVTSQVVAGTFSTGELAPGESKTIKAVVRLLKASNNNNIKNVRLWASGRRGSEDHTIGRVRPKGQPRSR